jgi:hypothetical protein
MRLMTCRHTFKLHLFGLDAGPGRWYLKSLEGSEGQGIWNKLGGHWRVIRTPSWDSHLSSEAINSGLNIDFGPS